MINPSHPGLTLGSNVGVTLHVTMINPPHSGLTLRDDVLPALGLSVTQATAQLDVPRVALSRVLNGRAAISPAMALRIEAWHSTSYCKSYCTIRWKTMEVTVPMRT
jgi:addiction module HigA family antidote